MQSKDEEPDFMAIKAQIEGSRRLVAEVCREGTAMRMKATPEAVLQSLDQTEKLLSILSSLSGEEIIASLAYLGYELGPHYRSVLEHFLANRNFNAHVRGQAAGGLGAMFERS